MRNQIQTDASSRATRSWRVFGLCAWTLCLLAGFGPSAVATELPADQALVGAARRDWTAHPAIAESDSTNDIYALGDTHGDYQRATALLIRHHILAALPDKPEHARWSAGRATLVCTGDYIDKWTDGLKVVTLLQALQASAGTAGGQVHLLLGNHEVEFLADPKGSKTAQFASELTAAGIKPSDVAKGTNPLGVFLRNLPIGARVREWFFSHAGNTAGRTLAALKHDLQTGVDAKGFGTPVLTAADSIVESKLSSGAWWEGSGTPAGTLSAYTSALGVKHLVFGHQPNSYTFSGGGSRTQGELFQAFGMVFLIDAGMSQGVDYSEGALLRITGSGTAARADVLRADGTVTELWHG